MRIRAVRGDDFPILQDIERAGGLAFREVGMPEVGDDEPFSLEVFADYELAGLAWVAVDADGAAGTDAAEGVGTADDTTATDGSHATDGRPVAYLVAEYVDGDLHVEQVSVHPDYARRGIGRSLLEHLASYAEGVGVAALTLTTFADVPWNAPYYARCGFDVVPDDELSPGLRAVRQREADAGLDRWPRICMRRPIIPTPVTSAPRSGGVAGA